MYQMTKKLFLFFHTLFSFFKNFFHILFIYFPILFFFPQNFPYFLSFFAPFLCLFSHFFRFFDFSILILQVGSYTNQCLIWEILFFSSLTVIYYKWVYDVDLHATSCDSSVLVYYPQLRFLMTSKSQVERKKEMIKIIIMQG